MTQMESIRNKAKQNATESTTVVIAFPKKDYVKLSLCIYMYGIVHVHNNNFFYIGGDLMWGEACCLLLCFPTGAFFLHCTYVPILNFDSLGECSHWGNRGRVV